jgi:hypothetical protein
MRREPGEGPGASVYFLPESRFRPAPGCDGMSWEIKGFDNLRFEKLIIQRAGLRNTFYLVKIFKIKFGFAVSGNAR